MNRGQLYESAQKVIDRALAALPQDLREAADACVVNLEDRCELEDGEDLLGLFEGCSRLDGEPACPEDLPRITLYLMSLWEWCEMDPATYRDEVRITLLHELAHYFGWDEEETEARGLG